MFLEQLHQSHNEVIASVLEQNKGLAFTLLREKAKSMRSEEKRKAVRRRKEELQGGKEMERGE